MFKKINQVRRSAFLKALGETGNLTLAAERAKVSRNWAMYVRRREPAFDEACRAALAGAKARLAGAEGRGPPSGWGFLDGEELVVKGSGGSGGGRRVQIARARIKQWTPRVEDRFLATLAATCNVKAACAEVGMTAASAYNHRKRWPAFARRWDDAVKWAHLRLDSEILAAGISLFSGEGLPEDGPIPEMTVMDAIHYLSMHRHAVHGTGRRPGRRR